MISILRLTEKACALLAASASLAANLDATVYAGQSNEEKTAPAIICNCANGSPDYPDASVFHVRTEIHVKEMAADSNLSSSLADTIFAAFENPNTANNLTNQVSNYLVYDILQVEPSNTESGDAWVQTVTYDIVCMLT